jgi:hypothetical protein
MMTVPRDAARLFLRALPQTLMRPAHHADHRDDSASRITPAKRRALCLEYASVQSMFRVVGSDPINIRPGDADIGEFAIA